MSIKGSLKYTYGDRETGKTSTFTVDNVDTDVTKTMVADFGAAYEGVYTDRYVDHADLIKTETTLIWENE